MSNTPDRKKNVAVIPARGGSKGIPGKNLIDFCGKPLLAWSIEHALGSELIDSVWVSSDSNEILSVAESYGVGTIVRPEEISGDSSSSESVWIHALDYLTKKEMDVGLMIGLQATSPLRTSKDIDAGIRLLINDGFDSVFSGATIEDFFIWEESAKGMVSQNYDYKKRRRRQDINKTYVENGSFYIFKPDFLLKNNNRLAGKVGISLMEFWKTFEIDNLEDKIFCEVLMNGYLINQ